MKRTTRNIFLIVALLLFVFFIAFYYCRNQEGFDKVNHMDGVDAVYWINLDRSPERKKSMESMLSEETFKDIPHHRISATDGKVPDKMYQKTGDFKKQDGVTDYEYACLISHLDTIKEFSESKHEVALILEDDATLEFKKYWKSSMRDVIKKAPEDWEIIMLWYNVEKKGFNEAEFKKYRPGEDFYTLAYLINKKGAKKFIKSHTKNEKYIFNDSAQHKADWYLYTNMVTYSYKFPYFIYKTENDSLIHDDNLKFHIANKNNAIQEYEKLAT